MDDLLFRFLFIIIIAVATSYIADILIDAFSDLIYQARIQENKKFYENYDK